MAKKRRSTKKTSGISRNDGKIILVILAICFLPFVITYYILKSEKLSKNAKIGIVSATWVICLILFVVATVSNKAENERLLDPTYNIQKLEISNTDSVTVKIGEKTKEGKVSYNVKSKEAFSVDDIVFVSENPSVANIEYVESTSSYYLNYVITGVNSGETDVYAMIKDSEVSTEKIHVIVPEPILVQAININCDKSSLVLGESAKVDLEIVPDNAENKEIVWISSDESVAKVDSDGVVSSVSGGEATITAKADNGVEESIDFDIDGSKSLMNLSVKHPRNDDVNIGDEWSYDIQVNGERAPRSMGISVGDKLSFSAKITESDDNPDIGTAKTSYTVKQEDVDNGFEVKMEVKVTENGGRYSGKSAIFEVIYTFSPANK